VLRYGSRGPHWGRVKHDLMVGKVVRVFFLRLLVPKSSSLSRTLVILAQISNCENNIFHKLLFLDRLDRQACKT